ncbi:MAG: hypothetical protein ABTQ25_15935 [Nitrosomonas ureae]
MSHPAQHKDYRDNTGTYRIGEHADEYGNVFLLSSGNGNEMI